MKTPYSAYQLQEICESKGYIFHVCSPGRSVSELNIIGVRSKDSRPNYFDDELHLVWQANGYTHHSIYPITTLPGIPYLKNPINPKGTAILKPGQYFLSHSLGQFKGYTALKQVALLTVYRDNDRDEEFDILPGKTDKGIFGIHIHKAGVFSKIVGLNSAGCQVFQKADDFAKFIKICKQSADFWGNSFTYTLIDEE